MRAFSSLGSSSGSVIAARKAADHGNFDEFVERLLAEELVDAIGKPFDRGAIDDLLRRRGEHELFAGIGERVVGDQRGDVAEFGSFGLQEFATRGNAVEKIGDTDGGACRKARGFHADKFAAGEFDARAFGLLRRRAFRAAGARQRRWWEGLRRENPACDGEEIVGGAQLAGGVALEGEQRVIVGHAVAVVDDANHALAAGFDFDADGFGAGVERVFEQLFDDGGGPLDDFARGDAVGDSFRENADA